MLGFLSTICPGAELSNSTDCIAKRLRPDLQGGAGAWEGSGPCLRRFVQSAAYRRICKQVFSRIAPPSLTPPCLRHQPSTRSRRRTVARAGGRAYGAAWRGRNDTMEIAERRRAVEQGERLESYARSGWIKIAQLEEGSMKIDGGCHCGFITYEAEADPEQTTICHCTDCQMLTGLGIPDDCPGQSRRVSASLRRTEGLSEDYRREWPKACAGVLPKVRDADLRNGGRRPADDIRRACRHDSAAGAVHTAETDMGSLGTRLGRRHRGHSEDREGGRVSPLIPTL